MDAGQKTDQEGAGKSGAPDSTSHPAWYWDEVWTWQSPWQIVQMMPSPGGYAWTPEMIWWMRGAAQGTPAQFLSGSPEERHWLTGAYPSLLPFYPMTTADPAWMDAWAMQPYHGYWWG